MGHTKFFETWTFNRPLPEPFAGEVAKAGKKTSVEPESISKHNHMSRGKRATLHAPTLRALIAVSEIIDGAVTGAFGLQSENNMVKWYCMEYARTVGTIRETRIILYDPINGRCKGMMKNGTVLSSLPVISDKGGSGKEILMLFAYASLKQGLLYDAEFAATFERFSEERKKGFPNTEKAMMQAFLLCDNLYRRIENSDSLGGDGIPFDNSCVSLGNVPIITQARLESGYYAPTETSFGIFQVLKTSSRKTGRTIADLKNKYRRNFPLTEEEENLVPRLPENYDVPEEVSDILEAVLNTPMRVFMSAGESGTGKTTNARMVAQMLGLPYYSFTCGEGTDEVDLVSSMIPNIGGTKAVETAVFPTYEDMMMDPASALERVTGIYEEEIDKETAFQEILARIYQKGYQSGQGEKDYIMVESSIVTGCRRPSIIEIQEPSVITKPGTLVRLNGLLDDGASITLTSGEVVRRNPETVILLTTNMGYRGCKGFNESVLSRMRMVLYSDPLTSEEMVYRIQKKITVLEPGMLKKMADAVCAIQKHCRTEMITGGVCGYREYEDWVWAYLVQKDVRKAALRTIVAKAAPEEEEREEIYKTQILTRFTEEPAVKAA